MVFTVIATIITVRVLVTLLGGLRDRVSSQDSHLSFKTDHQQGYDRYLDRMGERHIRALILDLREIRRPTE